MVWELARAGISAICAHTNLDKARGGVNDCLAAALGLEQVGNYAVEGREKHCKLTVFVPNSHAEAVRQAIIGAGAGTIGGYTGCTFSVEGTGRFLPGEGTSPYLGQPGRKGRCGGPPGVGRSGRQAGRRTGRHAAGSPLRGACL